MKEARATASATLAARVRDLRHRMSISQRRLADLADVDASQVVRIESGQGNPRLFTLIQIATALETTAEILVSGLSVADLPDQKQPYSAAQLRAEQARRRSRDIA